MDIFHRLLSRNTLLYTEMMTTGALVHLVDRGISDMLKRLDKYSSAKAADLLASGEIGSLAGNGSFTLQNGKLLRVSLGPDVLSAKGAMVAYQGQVDFDHQGQGMKGFMKKALTGEGMSLMRVAGQGEPATHYVQAGAVLAYTAFLATATIAFRDGLLQSLLRQLLFYAAPVLALALLVRFRSWRTPPADASVQGG